MTWRLGKGAKDIDAADLDAARVLLGVSRFDTAERIRERHRALIAQNHPDAGGSDAQAAALNKARDLLLDDLNDKRL
jgi:curved DNA-binding protein CbpA